jgi:putative SOS response-associated peptidase YedK
MCGRYTLAANQRPERHKWNVSLPDRFNIAPQSDVLIQLESGAMALRRWSYSPRGTQPSLHITNVRAETLLQKRVFKNARRCAFVADGWYEWQRLGANKTPWYHYSDGALLLFAGIYEDDSGCAIVTTEAQARIEHVHHRQPMLLDNDGLDAWLDGAAPDVCMRDLPIECYPVSRRVNRAGIDDSSLIRPASEDVEDDRFGQTADLFAE